MTVEGVSEPRSATLRVPLGTQRVVVLYEGTRPEVVTESLEVVAVPRIVCRAIKTCGERCGRTSWTAVLNEAQLCSCHTLWLQEGRSVMQMDAGWPMVGRAHGLEVPAVMGL